jgi:hypothetical protein
MGYGLTREWKSRGSDGATDCGLDATTGALLTCKECFHFAAQFQVTRTISVQQRQPVLQRTFSRAVE